MESGKSVHSMDDLLAWAGDFLGGDPERRTRLLGGMGDLNCPPFEWLAEAFGLTDFERFCVLLALSGALMRGRPVCSYGELLDLWGDRAGGRASLMADSVFSRFLLERPDDRLAGMDTPLRLHEDILGWLVGEPAPARTAWYTLCEPENATAPMVTDADLPGRMMRYLAARPEESQTLFCLTGPEGSGKSFVVRHFAHMAGQPVLMVHADAALLEEIDGFADRMMRRAVIERCVICLDGLEAIEDRRIISRLAGAALEVGRVLFVTTRTEWPDAALPPGCAVVRQAMLAPDWEGRRELWRAFTAGRAVAADVDFDELAGKFVFTPGQIKSAAEAAADIADWVGRPAIDAESIRQGCYSRLGTELGGRAVRVSAAFAWEDLILPEAAKRQLAEACDQVRHRHQVYGNWGFGKKVPYGRGVSMLFSGPPGTGKTMAAQVVAARLGLELYKVDLAVVVSKYIGETEKNLSEVFAGAARSQSVLFFDEADSLFAKRTEVRDSNDRYGNMEAAFLLQKMEEYDGICVLATNYAQNFDEAFRRRIRFHINFPFPDAHYRALLWQAVFPPEVPLAPDINWQYLAGQFEFSGSSIKNIAVNAAFIAAAEGGPVDMRAILRALHSESRKAGKMLASSDFGEYYMMLGDDLV